MSETECPNCKSRAIDFELGRNQYTKCKCRDCGSEFRWSSERMSVDHQKLLIKYIQHVEDSEGVNFILNGTFSKVDFTPEEWAELEALAIVAREGATPTGIHLSLEELNRPKFVGTCQNCGRKSGIPRADAPPMKTCWHCTPHLGQTFERQ
jgi:hypothetical protein